MADHSKMCLGKKPAKVDARTLKLAKYFLPSLPAPPDAADYTEGITSWRMMLNNKLGCCTISAVGHAEQVWSAARKGEWTPPDDAILQKYEQWCGYDPSDPSTDQGGFEVDVLNHWRRTSFWDHPLLAYADPDPTNLDHIKQAIFLFGGVYIGLSLPTTAQTQDIWDVVGDGQTGDSAPGSWGGHAVFVPAYRTDESGAVVFTCITWGENKDMTEAFWRTYLDEAHALITPEFLSLKTGNTPEGLDLETLEADLQLVTG